MRFRVPLVDDWVPGTILKYGVHWCWSDDLMRFWYKLDSEVREALKVLTLVVISAILIVYRKEQK